MRTCSSCDVCCVVAAVPEIDKPPLEPCPLLRPSPDGCCSVVGESGRPSICRSFRCAWLEGVGTDDDRPDRIGAMFSVNRTERGRIGLALESEPEAILNEARDMAVAFVRGHAMPLVVGEFGKLTAGEWVVIHDDLREKAAAMIGSEVARLASDVGMYERVDP